MTKARSRGELLSSSCFDLSFVKVLVGMSGGKLALELFFRCDRSFGCILLVDESSPDAPFRGGLAIQVRNLVDPASSHMLVSKIKPCMSWNKFSFDESAKSSL